MTGTRATDPATPIDLRWPHRVIITAPDGTPLWADDYAELPAARRAAEIRSANGCRAEVLSRLVFLDGKETDLSWSPKNLTRTACATRSSAGETGAL